jgi:hypothetical protein
MLNRPLKKSGLGLLIAFLLLSAVLISSCQAAKETGSGLVNDDEDADYSENSPLNEHDDESSGSHLSQPAAKPALNSAAVISSNKETAKNSNKGGANLAQIGVSSSSTIAEESGEEHVTDEQHHAEDDSPPPPPLKSGDQADEETDTGENGVAEDDDDADADENNANDEAEDEADDESDDQIITDMNNVQSTNVNNNANQASVHNNNNNGKVFQSHRSKLMSIITKPGILAGIVGGAIIGILTGILLIMFIVYRMRKKDEGSYALEESKKPFSGYDYRPCAPKEFYA